MVSICFLQEKAGGQAGYCPLLCCFLQELASRVSYAQRNIQAHMRVIVPAQWHGLGICTRQNIYSMAARAECTIGATKRQYLQSSGCIRLWADAEPLLGLHAAASERAAQLSLTTKCTFPSHLLRGEEGSSNPGQLGIMKHTPCQSECCVPSAKHVSISKAT